MTTLVFLLLFAILPVTLFLNRYPKIRSGYLLIDLPILLIVLALTVCFEVVVSLLPDWARRKQDLDGKLALLTGAGSGIGRETSLELSKQGCTLVLWDVNERGNEETARLIRESGGRAFVYTVDVSDREALESAAESVIREHGLVDILVCNAGILNFNRLYKVEHYEIDRLMTINFVSIVWLTKYFLQKMVERGTGHIVCMASLAAFRGTTHTCIYSASKCALSSFYTSLMEELETIYKCDVNVSVVYPSAVDTPLLGPGIPQVFAKMSPVHVAKVIIRGIRIRRQFISIPSKISLLALICFLVPVYFMNTIQPLLLAVEELKDI